jgi:hypothetical protein
MAAQKYTPIVETVSALQLTQDNEKSVSNFLRGVPTKFLTTDGRETNEPKDAEGQPHRNAVLVPTNAGQSLAVQGDYITRDAAGSFQVFTEELFERTYRKVAPNAAKKAPAKK